MSDWRDDFTRYTTGFAFQLSLSRDQASLLEAISLAPKGFPADWVGASGRGTFVPCVKALDRRGLIEHNPAHALNERGVTIKWHYRLTPAGQHVLELLRLSGVAVTRRAANEVAA